MTQLFVPAQADERARKVNATVSTNDIGSPSHFLYDIDTPVVKSRNYDIANRVLLP